MRKPLVRDVLNARKDAESVFGERSDPWKVWLVLESGGQAGAVMGGFVSALEALGYRDCFDGVVGCSAGAMTGAYFAAGQACLGTTIYAEDNCDERFISFWRLLTTKPVMDLDYLVDEVMGRVKPLDTKTLGNMKMPVLAMAARRDGKARVLPLHGQPQDVILNSLKVTARVPVWGSRKLRGHHVWDGALGEPIPIQTALEHGATHVLHVSRRDVREEGLGEPWMAKHIQRLFLRMKAPDLDRIYATRRLVEGLEEVESFKLALLEPDVGIATTDRRRIWKAARRAFRHAEVWLTGEERVAWPVGWV